MDTRAPGLKLGDQLCFALYDASRAVIRAYGPLLGEVGLTYPQYLVMLVLWETDGPLPVGRLGSSLHLENGTLTPLLKRLEQQGLVSRTRDPNDDRRVLIALTSRGNELRTRVAAIPAQVFACCAMDPEAAGLLRQTLTELARSLD
jgi:DNA-binding MarR family transcriptional regulator